MNRRSWLKSLGRAACIVALAPQLAFRVKPVKNAVFPAINPRVGYWIQTCRETSNVNAEFRKAFIEAFYRNHPPYTKELLEKSCYDAPERV